MVAAKPRDARRTLAVMEDPGTASLFNIPRRSINDHLAGLVASLDIPASLRGAIEYALLGGGKRLRPILAWHCCVAAAGDGEAGPASLPAGAAVELVHAFSLVHDDLPAMDDDDLRRGRPTLHIHSGEAMAILAGDAMLALAFGALGDSPAGPPGDRLRSRLAEELVRGTIGMISGQVLDTIPGERARAGPGDAERVERIHALKTGALISASCRMGALIGLARSGRDESDPVFAAIDSYGASAGLMFQIVDDLLDIEQTAERVGKRTGKDAGAGKLTHPGVHGVEATREKVKELWDRTVSATENMGEMAGPLVDLAGVLARRTR